MSNDAHTSSDTVRELATYACEECGARIKVWDSGEFVTDECPDCFEDVYTSTLSHFRKVDTGTERSGGEENV